jgi:quinol monooxygenase YgiN
MGDLSAMPIYKTAQFKVKLESVEKCRQVLQEYMTYLRQNDPGTQSYLCLQDEKDATSFLILGIYVDSAGQSTHGRLEGAKNYVDKILLETAGPVTYTDYAMAASMER